MPAEVVVRAGLAEGVRIDRERARMVRRELRRVGALAAAGKALRSRDLSAQHLDTVLSKARVAPRDRSFALETLERAGLVSDERLALARAGTLAERGAGDAAIRDDLRRRGIPPELVASAMAGLDPEPERASRIATKRGKNPATARYLLRKGFGEDSIEAALGDLFASDR